MTGGLDSDGGNLVTSAELYDPGSGTWSATGDMTARASGCHGQRSCCSTAGCS